MQDAYTIALARWPLDGLPKNPAAWIITTARNSAIDRLRREKNAALKLATLATLEALVQNDATFEEPVMDDRLAMIFAACHPALNDDTRIALTLRFAAGLTAAEISTALLTPVKTIAQRLVRAKRKIRDACIPFTLPESTALPERLHDVLRVIYLIFNEGYASATHAERVRSELCNEAIRLVELLERLLPAEPEIEGLHALMLFHDARRETRLDDSGDIILLEAQDRSRWDTRKIVRGLTLLENAFRHHTVGSYQVQAAIAAEHARASKWEETNWFRIREWYEALLEIEPSPVIEINRAVAISYTEGMATGLAALDAVAADCNATRYAPLYAAQAELLRRLQRIPEARAACLRALELTQSASDRRFLQKQLERL